MDDGIIFGTFIRQKRMEMGKYLSLRELAKRLKISPVYMSNIETGREAAPSNAILAEMVNLLSLNKQETELMYDLAAKSKKYTAVPGDLPEYISANEYAKIALRVAKDVDATDEEWIEFIEKLKQRATKGS